MKTADNKAEKMPSSC